MPINNPFEAFPVLETENLILRKITRSDSKALFGILSDDQVTRYYDDDTLTNISQASDQITSWERGYKNKVCIRWGISRKNDEKMIGSCGFYSIYTRYLRASIGYELARSLWRKQIMTEALGAILDYGFTEMGLNRIDALIMPGNTASIRLLEKLGFQKEGLLAEYERWGRKGLVDLCIYAILYKTWQAKKKIP